jgi:hypothetical protein
MSWTSVDMGFKLDNQAGSLTDISAYVNQASLTGILAMLEDSALGDSEQTYEAGLAGGSITINGFVVTTTDGIFGPLIGNRSSVTKTFNFQSKSDSHFTGEVRVSNVQYSGQSNNLQTFSADLQISGAVTRSSVAAS